MSKLHLHKIPLQNGKTQRVGIILCSGTDEVQKKIASMLGYLPTSCTEVFMMAGAGQSPPVIILREESSNGRIAHEVFHATVAICRHLGIDCNNYDLVRPFGNDFGYIPAEVAADLCEQLVNLIHELKALATT